MLHQPAVGDNAAKQSEPPNAEPPKQRRRWYQFSLRSLMIGVTLVAVVCGYVGGQAEIVRERKAMMTWIIQNGGLGDGPNPHDLVQELPGIRKLLGDRRIAWIAAPEATTTEQLAEIKANFPEAPVVLRHPSRPATKS